MKYGFTMPGRGPLATPERLGIIARKGEEFGFDALLTGDHILVPKNISSPYPYTEGGEFPGSSSGESMEQITLLSYIAGQTSKIRLVTSVLIVPHRNPLIAAKSLATLDVLSGGRLVVGVGVGWMREEFEALGLPPFEERGAVTDEYIRAFKVLWTEDSPQFEGKYISFDDITFLPKPVQKPHPPIWIGGGLMSAWRTAKYGECVVAFWPGEDDARRVWIPKLADEGAKYGTDPKLTAFTFVYVSDDENDYARYTPHLEKAVSFEQPDVDYRKVTVSGSPEQCAERIHALHDAGVWHFVLEFQFHGLESVTFGMRQMEKFAKEVGPLL